MSSQPVSVRYCCWTYTCGEGFFWFEATFLLLFHCDELDSGTGILIIRGLMAVPWQQWTGFFNIDPVLSCLPYYFCGVQGEEDFGNIILLHHELLRFSFCASVQSEQERNGRKFYFLNSLKRRWTLLPLVREQLPWIYWFCVVKCQYLTRWALYLIHKPRVILCDNTDNWYTLLSRLLSRYHM